MIQKELRFQNKKIATSFFWLRWKMCFVFLVKLTMQPSCKLLFADIYAKIKHDANFKMHNSNINQPTFHRYTVLNVWLETHFILTTVT